MFKKAKKRASSEELKNQRTRCEEQFETRIAQANGIDDPAEKLLQLEKIRKALYNDDTKESNNIHSAVGKIHPFGRKQEAIAYALVLPTLLVGSVLYVNHLEKRDDRLTDQFVKEAQDHFRYLSKKYTVLHEMIDAMLEEHMQKILKSPLLKDILDQPALFKKLVDAHVEVVAKSPLCRDMQDDPSLLRQFAELALRGRIALPQENTAAPDAATVAIEKEMAAPRKMHDYGGLNALRPTRRTI